MSQPLAGESPPAHESEASPPLAEARVFAWSVRRELWENRWLVLAPLAIATIVLLGASASLLSRLHQLWTLPASAAASLQAVHPARPLHVAPAPIMLTTFVLGLLYALDALHGERRDRSILFWKSLPVSDRTTVLSKASIPIVWLPCCALLLSLATLALLLVLGTLIPLLVGENPSVLWSEPGLGVLPVAMVYGLIVHSLWFAPIYCWVLLISAWARRTPLLWTVLPPAGIGLLEHVALETHHFGSFLRYRVSGALAEAFANWPARTHPGATTTGLARLDPLRFLASPGLWTGLVFAALCLVLAMRVRRHREPL